MAPATSSGKTVWDAELRSELLMAVIRHAPPSSEQWALIIDEMQAKGHTFNANAAMYLSVSQIWQLLFYHKYNLARIMSADLGIQAAPRQAPQEVPQCWWRR